MEIGMKRISVIGFLCVFFSVANAAIVKIGIPFYSPPYVVVDKLNGPQGVDVDLMRNICNQLQWQCEFVPVSFGQLLGSLENNTIDYALGALVITPERRSQFLFSLPYMPSEAGFLLLESNPINSLQELSGKNIGVISGREYYHYAVEHFNNIASVVPYSDINSMVLDLMSGKIDAIFLNYLGGLYVEHQHPDEVKVLKENYPVGEGLGIATLPTNKQGIEQINKIILKFTSDGTFIRTYNYNFEFLTPSSSSKP